MLFDYETLNSVFLSFLGPYKFLKRPLYGRHIMDFGGPGQMSALPMGEDCLYSFRFVLLLLFVICFRQNSITESSFNYFWTFFLLRLIFIENCVDINLNIHG